MDEFVIQLGHYSLLVSGEEIAKEEGRNIYDYGDEISDILLQICAFCNYRKIRKENIKFEDIKCSEESIIIANIVSLSGQIIEAILENV